MYFLFKYSATLNSNDSLREQQTPELLPWQLFTRNVPSPSTSFWTIYIYSFIHCILLIWANFMKLLGCTVIDAKLFKPITKLVTLLKSLLSYLSEVKTSSHNRTPLFFWMVFHPDVQNAFFLVANNGKEGRGSAVWKLAEHEPAVCPGSREIQ